MSNKSYYESASETDVTEFIAEIEDINAADQDGLTPLHWFSACNAQPEVTVKILEAGGDIGLRTNHGFTALHGAAAYNKNPEIVRILVDKKAAVNARSESGLTPLHGAAAFNNNPAIVQELVKAGARIDSITKNSTTPMLAAAAYNENHEVIRTLAKNGANVNDRYASGETPLHLAAAFNRNPKVVELLVDSGADINAADRNGMSPLHRAARDNPEPSVTESLVTKGADVRKAAANGKTAIEYASKDRERFLQPSKEDLMETLGLEQWGTNKFFEKATPEDVEKCLQEGANADAVEKAQKLSPLSRAARHTNFGEVIQLLIRNGANVNSRDNRANTPLHWATKNKSIPDEVINILVQHGADVSARNSSQTSPLVMAARNAMNRSVVECIFSAGGSTQDVSESIALIQAALLNSKNRANIFPVLVDNGVDLNLQDEDGNSVVHILAKDKSRHSYSGLMFLLQQSVDSSLRNNQNQLAADIATKRNARAFAASEKKGRKDSATNQVVEAKKGKEKKETPQVPKDVGAETQSASAQSEAQKRSMATHQRNWGTKNFFSNASLDDVERCLKLKMDPNKSRRARTAPLLSAARYSQHPEVIKLLIVSGAQVDVTDKYGETPLHWATRNQHIAADAIEVLAANGADSTHRSTHDNSPICTATRHATRPTAVSALISAGADINDRKRKDGESLLHRALKNPTCKSEIMEVLLKNGMDINTRNGSGNTALHVAVRSRMWKEVEFLVKSGADPSLENNKKEKPIDIVSSANRKKLDQLLGGTDVDEKTKSKVDEVSEESAEQQAAVAKKETAKVPKSDAPESDTSEEEKDKEKS